MRGFTRFSMTTTSKPPLRRTLTSLLTMQSFRSWETWNSSSQETVSEWASLTLTLKTSRDSDIWCRRCKQASLSCLLTITTSLLPNLHWPLSLSRMQLTWSISSSHLNLKLSLQSSLRCLQSREFAVPCCLVVLLREKESSAKGWWTT